MNSVLALGTLFAAVAAVAGLWAVKQAAAFHDQDVVDRRAAREADATEFDRRMAERHRETVRELERLRLAQLERVSELVAKVRDAAITEADERGSLSSAPGTPRTFWNTRRQLGLSLNVYGSLGGGNLTQCEELAYGSTMGFAQQVVSQATLCFDELAEAALAD